MREIQKTAATLGISVISKSVADATDLEQTIEEFAKGEDGALAVITSPKMTSLRQPIAQLAAKFRLPAVYPLRSYVEAGGHGISEVGMYEQVPEIIDLILKGKPPGDIPVEAPTKTEFLIKKNAATNLGLQIPNSLVTRGATLVD